jgi:hypothetical protein
VRTRELLRKIDRTLDRLEERLASSPEEHLASSLEELREEHRLSREQFERHKRERRMLEELSRGAIERNTRVMRELLLQRQEDRVFLERIEQGIHAQTQGLLHVLDELRNGRGGPDAAPAG